MRNTRISTRCLGRAQESGPVDINTTQIYFMHWRWSSGEFRCLRIRIGAWKFEAGSCLLATHSLINGCRRIFLSE
jgi:hypothetical protein